MARKFKVPESRNEVDGLIKEIGELQIEKMKINDNLKQKIAALREEVDKFLETNKKEMTLHLALLNAYFTEHQKELTENGRISVVAFPSGEMAVFLTNPALSIKGEKRVIAELKSSGRKRFIRILEEVNKDAVLLEPEAVADIKGIMIIRKERFLVRPNTTTQAATQDIKKLKKLLK